MANIKVSVIMPTYNCGRYITESIRSIQSQTFENWELWIVDDHSTDDTPTIVEPFLTDTRIHYIYLQINGGPAAARNEALRHAKGDYVAFLDSDDIWSPDKLERQLAFMQRNKCFFSCTSYRKIDEIGRPMGTVILPYPSVGYWKAYFLSNPIGNSTVMYDRRYFGDRQVPLIRKRNDFALWLQLLRGGVRCYGMEDVLMDYRVRVQSVSSNKMGLAKYHWELYHHIENRNWLISVLGVFMWAVVKGTGLGLRIRKYKGNAYVQ